MNKEKNNQESTLNKAIEWGAEGGDSGTTSFSNSSASGRSSEFQNMKVTSNEKRKVMKCYNCQKNGHILRNCSEPKRDIVCFTCKQPGHIAPNC